MRGTKALRSWRMVLVVKEGDRIHKIAKVEKLWHFVNWMDGKKNVLSGPWGLLACRGVELDLPTLKRRRKPKEIMRWVKF